MSTSNEEFICQNKSLQQISRDTESHNKGEPRYELPILVRNNLIE